MVECAKLGAIYIKSRAKFTAGPAVVPSHRFASVLEGLLGTYKLTFAMKIRVALCGRTRPAAAL